MLSLTDPNATFAGIENVFPSLPKIQPSTGPAMTGLLNWQRRTPYIVIGNDYAAESQWRSQRTILRELANSDRSDPKLAAPAQPDGFQR